MTIPIDYYIAIYCASCLYAVFDFLSECDCVVAASLSITSVVVIAPNDSGSKWFPDGDIYLIALSVNDM